MGEVKIDVSDWEDRVKRNEVTVSSAEELVELAKKGVKSSDLTIIMLISQLWGMLEDEKVREPKSNFYFGGLHNLHQILRAKNKKVKVKDLSFTFHEMIGTTIGDDAPYVESTSKTGFARARKNLRETIPNFIKSQIIILHEGKQDWAKELDLLRASIDEIEVALSS